MTEELSKLPDQTESENIEAAEIIEEITKQNPRLFNGLNKQKRQEIIRAFSIGITQITKTHSGPLPDPQDLEHYDKVIPNGAERIMAMAEKEQSFRHTYSDKIAKRQLNQISRGQWFGLLIAIIGIGGGIFLSYLGKETTGLTTIIVSMASLVGVFVIGKLQEKK